MTFNVGSQVWNLFEGIYGLRNSWSWPGGNALLVVRGRVHGPLEHNPSVRLTASHVGPFRQTARTKPLNSFFHFDVLLVSCLPQVYKASGVWESQRLCVSQSLVGCDYNAFHLTPHSFACQHPLQPVLWREAPDVWSKPYLSSPFLCGLGDSSPSIRGHLSQLKSEA